ncbi:hypothetical protein GJ744_003138 [Endocarpon pusillum]|uniref:Uncharacterized protein n=1 Tax=Endocarpon pusillum TaxID=364733 RepID=A0A8H7AMF7_9EURO|nr:hypothetical protein GJ744_003138 [Endocarpon pusillum]
MVGTIRRLTLTSSSPQPGITPKLVAIPLSSLLRIHCDLTSSSFGCFEISELVETAPVNINLPFCSKFSALTRINARPSKVRYTPTIPISRDHR